MNNTAEWIVAPEVPGCAHRHLARVVLDGAPAMECTFCGGVAARSCDPTPSDLADPSHSASTLLDSSCRARNRCAATVFRRHRPSRLRESGDPGDARTSRGLADWIGVDVSEGTAPPEHDLDNWPIALSEPERGLARLLPVLGQDETTHYAIVDAAIYPAVSLFKWRFDHNGYVRRTTSYGDRRVLIVLHRLVMCCSTGDGLEIDHINRCKLDNRQVNLRYVTHSQNMRNGTRPVRPTWIKKDKRWRAKFRHDDRLHSLGQFVTYEEAEHVLRAALERHAAGGCDAV